jgi:hypothetical protein
VRTECTSVREVIESKTMQLAEYVCLKYGHRILPVVIESPNIHLGSMCVFWLLIKFVTCSNKVAGNNVKMKESALKTVTVRCMQ